MVDVHFELTARFEAVEDGWIQATIAEIPGVITAGPTQEEAAELLLDALREYWLAVSDVAPAPTVLARSTGAETAKLDVRLTALS